MSIYTELSRIQQGLKAPKNLFNKFGNYYYRNAEGILEAVKPMLNDLALIINDEPVLVGDRFYIKATVTLTDGKESVSAVAYAREDEQKKGMDGCQLTGACSSYARKYALNALLMIDDSKDSDDNSLSPKNPDNKEDTKKDDIPAPKERKKPTASVTTSDTVPHMVNNEERAAVEAYLLSAMKELREMREISATENNRIFGEQKDALIKAGEIPDKSLKDYTLDEAQRMIDLMHKRFSPSGKVIA